MEGPNKPQAALSSLLSYLHLVQGVAFLLLSLTVPLADLSMEKVDDKTKTSWLCLTLALAPQTIAYSLLSTQWALDTTGNSTPLNSRSLFSLLGRDPV